MLFLLVSAPCSLAQIKPDSLGTIEGMVMSLSDGDDIAFSNGGTEFNVRLYGIEAPEISKIHRNEPLLSRPGQRFAGRAFMALAKKVLHKQARLEIVHMSPHGTVYGILYVDDRNINLEMAAEGWAWASRKVRKDPAQAEYLLAEEQARAKKLGLWTQENPQPPWEFRKMRKVANHRDSW